MYFIPTEGELFPEWRIVFIIAFPGEENYYKLVINLEDKTKIESSDKWINIDEYHFNKDKCESFRFDTEIMLRKEWVSYTPEKAEEALKEELQAEMLKGSQPDHSNIGIWAGQSNDSLGTTNIEEAIRNLMSNSNKEKTGR